jgi:hypothetical protein
MRTPFQARADFALACLEGMGASERPASSSDIASAMNHGKIFFPPGDVCREIVSYTGAMVGQMMRLLASEGKVVKVGQNRFPGDRVKWDLA